MYITLRFCVSKIKPEKHKDADVDLYIYIYKICDNDRFIVNTLKNAQNSHYMHVNELKIQLFAERFRHV